MPIAEKSFLSGVASGDRSAFASLYDALSGETFGLCMRGSSARETAEELHRELWLFVWRHAIALSAARESNRAVILSIAQAMLRR